MTRRLDELVAQLARLAPAETPATIPVGEPLDEADRAGLAGLASLLAIGAPPRREEAWLLAVDRVIHRAGADCAAVFLPTAAGDLEAMAPRGFAGGAQQVAAGEGIVGRAFGEGETIRATPAHRSADRLLRDHGLTHALAVPIHLPAGPSLGVLFAGRRRPAAFGGDALEVITLAADRLALTLAEVRTTPAPPRPQIEIGGELDLPRTAGAVAREAARRLGAPCVALLLPDEQRLTVAATVGLPAAVAPPDPRRGAIAQVLTTTEPWVAAEEPGDEALAAFLGAPARLVFPLTAGGRLVALLVAGGPNPLGPRDLWDVAGPAAVAIRNAQLYAETVAALAEARGPARAPAPPTPPPVRDFANLLAVALARIALVRERVDDPAVGRELGVAEEAAWRAAEAVRSFLGFAPGHRASALLPLDLAGVVRAAIEGAQRRWSARGGAPPAVSLELEPIPPVRGDPDDLREAIDHVLENAAEAVPNAGTIAVRTRWEGGRRVEVVVENPGPGMDEAVRSRALEPFFSTKGPGRLGLGLPVAQAIVARHRGALELISAPGQGTTVRLSFPTASSGAQPDASLQGDTTPARVLVVEDEAHVRDALTALLRQHGHITLAAADGREGIAIVEREAIDAVFTDLGIPGQSGLEVARAVKRVRPGTPVVLITAWPGRLDVTTLQESGIDRVIEKPVGAPEVLAALDAALALRRPSRP